MGTINCDSLGKRFQLNENYRDEALFKNVVHSLENIFDLPLEYYDKKNNEKEKLFKNLTFASKTGLLTLN